jgi:nucleotide-binding universal stress UspA family protein
MASMLAHRLDAELDTVAIVEPDSMVDVGAVPPYVPTSEDNEALCAALRASVTGQLRRCEARQCAPWVLSGPAPTEITRAAEALHSHLIVTGLGPHGMIARAFGHETALQLAQTANTPVLAVPKDAAGLPHRAVAAIDFTQASIRAASLLAGWLGADDTLFLVHVRSHPRLARVPEEGSCGTRLDGIGARLGSAGGVRLETVLLDGHPAAALLDFMARSGSQMIALGNHGYGIQERCMMPTMTAKVMRHAASPTLVVPFGALSVAV